MKLIVARAAQDNSLSCDFLVDHQFEVDRASSVGAVVDDVLGPRFALDVDENAS
jgi:hypothetical protein